MKNIFGLKLLILVGLLLVSCNVQEQGNNISEFNSYYNEEYKISLKYPSNWSPNYMYSPERYEGEQGFFQISAAEGVTIESVVESHAKHKLNPYGTDPHFETLLIENNEARLIIPSENQPEDMKGQAMLIVEYPKAVKINNESYNFFILWSDNNHIREIAASLKISE